MKGLFEAIEKSDVNVKRIVLTVLEGEHIGEKILEVNGNIVWESREEGFFREYQEEISVLDKCGIVDLGENRVFCDILGQEMKIVICGAGHVSIPVIKIGKMMGCEVTVLEERPAFADRAREAGATKVICEPFEEGLEKIEGTDNTYFVIVTRGHRYDQICLEKIAEKKYAYIGMIGSRKRSALVKQTLLEKGTDKNVLDEVHTPIGLNIGAETPAEIAVAIAAEIIEVKNKKKCTCGYSKEIINAILDRENYPENKVLATIISRKGSAPQGVGTRMLICLDGRCVGTIGGGCMEARIIQKALLMAAGNDETVCVRHEDMTGADAEEEGMVCGGNIDVLMEVINS
ncbi:MAG: XdhC family protein [Lachnospiraceae bacterium]